MATTDLPALALPARRPVWEALSSLFLDTDESLDRGWRIRQLAASPYGLDELEAILIEEVYPVCGANLRSVAGVWDAFDLEWLEREILRRRVWPRRLLAPFNIGRFTMPRFDEWRVTRAGVQAARAAGARR